MTEISKFEVIFTMVNDKKILAYMTRREIDSLRSSMFSIKSIGWVKVDSHFINLSNVVDINIKNA